MSWKQSKTIPLLVCLLAGCSGSAPSATGPAAVGVRGGAAALTAVSDVRTAAHQLTARGAQNLAVSPGPNGSQVVRIRNGYSEVMLARTNADGTVSTGCVDSPAGADAFLDNPSPTPARAAQ